MLKSFVEVKFKICSIYKAQVEEKSPLKFTELFHEMRDTSELRDFNIREYRCEVYVLYHFDLKIYRIL